MAGPAIDVSKPNETPRSRLPSSSARVPCLNAMALEPKLEPTNASGLVAASCICSAFLAQLLTAAPAAGRWSGPGPTTQPAHAAKMYAAIWSTTR